MRVEENRSTQIREEQNKKNIKDANKSSNVNKQSASSQTQREQKTAFDQVMERVITPEQNPDLKTASFDSKIQESFKQDKEQPREEKKSESKDDKDKSSSKESSHESKPSSGVSARQYVHGQKGKGGQNSGQHSDQQHSQADKLSSKLQHQDHIKQENMVSASPFAKELSSIQTHSVTAPQATQEVPKQVLDQIVQYIRVTVGKGIDKEMQVDLSDKVFKGLSLKVMSKDGKIEVFFLTRHPDTRRLFENSKQDIMTQLQEKGVQVSNIEVKHVGSFS